MNEILLALIFMIYHVTQTAELACDSIIRIFLQALSFIRVTVSKVILESNKISKGRVSCVFVDKHFYYLNNGLSIDPVLNQFR